MTITKYSFSRCKIELILLFHVRRIHVQEELLMKGIDQSYYIYYVKFILAKNNRQLDNNYLKLNVYK